MIEKVTFPKYHFACSSKKLWVRSFVHQVNRGVISVKISLDTFLIKGVDLWLHAADSNWSAVPTGDLEFLRDPLGQLGIC